MAAAASLVLPGLRYLLIPGACLALAFVLALVVHVVEEPLRSRAFRKYRR